MILYLVNHRTDVCLRHYWLYMMLHEVGKTDAANQALFMQRLHRFPSIYILIKLLPLQGALSTANIPRVLPCAISFSPLRAYGHSSSGFYKDEDAEH